MLKKLCLAAALAASIPALAADYYVVTPLPGKQSAISVALNAYTLPPGTVGEAYSFDLAALLQVTGDSAFDANQAQWAITEGTLPDGLSLYYGKVRGTPAASAAGVTSQFTVTATYKTQVGTQSYSIPVVMPAPSVAVTGWGGAAPDGDFGEHSVGVGTSQKYFYILNEGPAGAIEGGFTLTGSPAFSVAEVWAVDRTNEGSTAACDSATATSRAGCKLADASSGYYAKKNLRVKLSFTPPSPGGHTAAITFTHNGTTGSPVTVNLTGRGAEIPPTTSITGWGGAVPNGAYGQKAVGSYLDQYFYIKNDGTQGRIIADAEVTGAAFQIVEIVAASRTNEITSANCQGTGNVRTGCTMADAASGYYAKKNLRVKVRFNASELGQHTGTLTFTHNGTSPSPVTIELSGEAVAP